MATLKKGILGTPRGKIRSIMGYTRYGKGVIQTVPTVKDKVARIWNIYQSIVLNDLRYVWQNMRSTDTTAWINNSPPNMTGEEYYLSESMKVLNVNKVNTVANGYINYLNLSLDQPISCEIDYVAEVLTITVLDGFAFFVGSALANFNVLAYGFNANPTSLTLSFPDRDNRVYSFDISGIMNPTRQFFGVRLLRYTPVAGTRIFLCNPVRRT